MRDGPGRRRRRGWHGIVAFRGAGAQQREGAEHQETCGPLGQRWGCGSRPDGGPAGAKARPPGRVLGTEGATAPVESADGGFRACGYAPEKDLRQHDTDLPKEWQASGTGPGSSANYSWEPPPIAEAQIWASTDSTTPPDAQESAPQSLKVAVIPRRRVRLARVISDSSSGETPDRSPRAIVLAALAVRRRIGDQRQGGPIKRSVRTARHQSAPGTPALTAHLYPTAFASSTATPVRTN